MKFNSSPMHGNPKSPAFLSKMVRSVDNGADSSTGPTIAHMLDGLGMKKAMSSKADLQIITKV
jgi:hypothetical protein